MDEGIKKYDVVMLGMSEWWEWNEKGIVNRNYHILQNLKKRPEIGKILYIDYLPYTAKRAFKSYLKSQLFVGGNKLIRSRFTNKLFEESENFYRYATIDSAIGSKQASRNINKILEKLDFNNTLLWSYLPIRIEAFANIKASVRIFDAVDNWAQHPGYADIKDRIENNYKEIENLADEIFTVSSDMKEKLSGNKNTHWIPNGVDIEHFVKESGIKNQELRILAKDRKIVGYVGIIQKRFDVELVEYVVENNKDKFFVFAGMVWPDAGADRLEKYENVKFIGHKKYQELPKYINQFDVAIIPHRIDEFTKSMNPLKLYEYLSCGKPVVTTDVAGVDDFEDLMYLAKDKESFSEKINLALDEQSVELEVKRSEGVKKHSWDNRVDRMMEIIKSK